MTEQEIIERKIALTKQWLSLLNKYSSEDLQLPNYMTKQAAIDEALDELIYLQNQKKDLENEK